MITSRMGQHASARPDDVASVCSDLIREQLPRVAPTPVSYAWVKRCLDIAFASLFLTVFAVPLLLVALLVKLTSKGPVFYRCDRVGLGGETFKFLKFRTMRVGADECLPSLLGLNEKDGPIFKMTSDPRVTPIGTFLRKSSVDEVPQMFHVLTGKMTLVGPRPPLPREVLLYSDSDLHRLSVKPGLTCYWQIRGRSDLSFEKWMELDREYIREMSLWTDIKILAKTPLAVLSGRGAY